MSIIELECIFVERSENEWYYVLGEYDGSENTWTWFERATAYGSFCSFDAAKEHLDNHEDPGGYNVYQERYYRAFFSDDQRAILEKLFKRATKI